MHPRAITSGLRRLFRRSAADDDLSDEVAHYLEMSTREHMRRGLSRVDAERAARLELGGVEAAKESVRAVGWDAGVERLARDLAYGARSLRRSPAFTIIATATLALGIGANTAMFSVVNAVLLRPLPFHDAARLVLVWTSDVRRGLQEEGTAYRTISDWRAESHALRDVAYFASQRAPTANDGVREFARTAYVSGNLFSTLGMRPLLGRTITPEDDANTEPVVVISYALWQRRFGGDSSVLGKSLLVENVGQNGVVAERIVGVMPPRFYFPDRNTDYWLPATANRDFRRESTERFAFRARQWTVVARLASGANIDGARADLQRIGTRLTALYPSEVPDFPGFTTTVTPILDHFADRDLQRGLWLLLGAVALVLVVACANVANLMLARGSVRQHELSIRRALGASRARIVAQLAAESMLLALVGGAAGLAVATAITRAVAVAAASRIPRIEEIQTDGRVFAFAFAASVVAGLIFGVGPALRGSNADPHAALAEGRHTSSRRVRNAREALVVAECALALVLLVGAGLLVRSLGRLLSVDAGYDAANVITARLGLPPEGSPEALGGSPERAAAGEEILNDLARRVAAIPGVDHAGFIDDMFISRAGHQSIAIPGRANVMQGELHEALASPDLFATLRVPLERGRSLTHADAQSRIHAQSAPAAAGQSLDDRASHAIAEPVVVNDAFVRRFFPTEDPIGRRFCTDPTGKAYWYEIVGVVGNMRQQALDRAAIPEYFRPYLPSPNARVDLVVHVRGDAASVAPMVRQVVTANLHGVMITTVAAADQQLGNLAAERSFQTSLLAGFAALALMLAAIGIYGVVHYAVAERTREIGIRLALGAAPSDVIAMVLREGMRLPAVGIAVGLGGAALTGRVLSHLLFEIGRYDAATFAGVGVMLSAIALLACYLPARRAASIDPVSALRRE